MKRTFKCVLGCAGDSMERRSLADRIMSWKIIRQSERESERGREREREGDRERRRERETEKSKFNFFTFLFLLETSS